MKRGWIKRKPAVYKLPAKGYQPPEWFTSIKFFARDHGDTPAKKILWRVSSMVARERDFNLYGKCVSCPKRFSDWREGQAGHWLPFSRCNSWYAYDIEFNISLQCADCNEAIAYSGADVGHAMGEELKRRHGDDVLERIRRDNLACRSQKMEVWEIVAKVEELVR